MGKSKNEVQATARSQQPKHPGCYPPGGHCSAPAASLIWVDRRRGRYRPGHRWDRRTDARWPRGRIAVRRTCDAIRSLEPSRGGSRRTTRSGMRPPRPSNIRGRQAVVARFVAWVACSVRSPAKYWTRFIRSSEQDICPRQPLRKDSLTALGEEMPQQIEQVGYSLARVRRRGEYAVRSGS